MAGVGAGAGPAVVGIAVSGASSVEVLEVASVVVGAGRPSVSVVANVASALEAEAAARAGADGIGLVRTELLFLGRSTPPSVGEQRTTYGRILAAMGDRPVVFRTLDVGGDKPGRSGSRRWPRRTRRSVCAGCGWACVGRPCSRTRSKRCWRPPPAGSCG